MIVPLRQGFEGHPSLSKCVASRYISRQKNGLPPEALKVPERRVVEAGGIEPPSEGLPPNMTTCLADVLMSLLEPPTAGSLGASRFGFQPHPLRQRNQPIPLNDVLSNPVGEGR